MWKKIMFGIIIGVVLLTVSTGVIYGAQINPASSATSPSVVFAGNGKCEGNGANKNVTGGCDGTGDCINENGTGNCAGKGTGKCTNENCAGDCNGTGGCANCGGTGECTNQNCTGSCNEGLIKQNGQDKDSGNFFSANCPNLQNSQKQNNSQNISCRGAGIENEKAGSGCGYSQSGKYKYSEQYTESNMFRNAFARFLNFFKFGNNS